MTSFSSLGVPERLVSVLDSLERTEPFPIQRDTLPDSLAGRDVLGRGRTGSGKTLAFALPLVARLGAGGPAAVASARVSQRPRGLVLAPTRELATQIAATVRPLAEAMGLRVTTIFGGVGQKPQEEALRRGVDIVVACPGRLDDLMKQGLAKLDRVEIAVLDEADHMADLGFLPVVTRILAATPPRGQRMLFSATLDRGVDGVVKRFLHDEVRHSVDESSVPAAAMEHRVLLVEADDKDALVERLASGEGRRILFTRTKHHAKKLAKKLTAKGIPAVDLQGNLSQGARERNLAAFSREVGDGGVRVLVATDVAARGVHVDDVELVVHVDPPEEHKAYLHRSGRTARAGAEGIVVTVATPTQRRDVEGMLRQAGIRAPFEKADAAAEAVNSLVGPRAAHIEPVAVVQPAPSQRRAAPARSGGSSGEGGGRRTSRRRGSGSGSGSGRSGGSGSTTVWSSGSGASGRSGGSGKSGRSGGSGGSGRSGGSGASGRSGGSATPSRSTGGAAAFSARSGRSRGR